MGSVSCNQPMPLSIPSTTCEMEANACLVIVVSHFTDHASSASNGLCFPDWHSALQPGNSPLRRKAASSPWCGADEDPRTFPPAPGGITQTGQAWIPGQARSSGAALLRSWVSTQQLQSKAQLVSPSCGPRPDVGQEDILKCCLFAMCPSAGGNSANWTRSRFRIYLYVCDSFSN